MMPETNMAPRFIYTSLLLFCSLTVHCFAVDSGDNIDCGTPIGTDLLSCCNVTGVFSKWTKHQLKCRTRRTDCDFVKCSFNEGGWMETPQKVNIAAISGYLTNWAESHAEWRDSIREVTTECVSHHIRPIDDEHRCEPISIIMCLMNSIFRNCPLTAWKNTPDCVSLRTHALNCGSEYGVFN